MKFSEKTIDKLVNKLIGNPNIKDKEKIILDRYYNSGDSFSKKIRDFKFEAWKLDEGLDSLSYEFSKFYENFIKNHPIEK